MTDSTSTDEIYRLIDEIPKLKGPELLERAEELFRAAEQGIRKAGDASALERFYDLWYGTDPGFFWMVWDKIVTSGKANIIWSQEPLRRLILLPAEHIFQMGMISGDFEETRTLLSNYFVRYLNRADSRDKEEIARRLWKAIGTRVSETWLKSGKKELKAQVGASLNNWRAEVEVKLAEADQRIGLAAEEAAAARERIDLSLPGVERAIGTRHLIQQTFDELIGILLSIGFSVVEGPEIETPYYNFEALNIPEHHPARDNMDTFYIEGSRRGHLLRTHTSPMQIRTMEKQPPPVRIVVPGKAYRRDNPDATHGYMFHQLEGLAVDTDITFCDFKGTVEYFVREFLGPKVRTRLRPSYFPFTEPSAEVDASCHVCGGSGCRICKFSGWIELFGAGMVNPAVYGFVNYDPEKLSGFAFGIGVDRFAMMKYGVTELPLLFQNDVRFLRQFP